MKKFNIIIYFVIGFLLAAAPAVVLADKATNFGLKSAGDTAGLTANQLSTSGGIAGILGTLVGVLLSLVGVFFFLLILWNGFIWMTAQGAAEKVDSAKKGILSACIGLVIVLSSYAIGNYVFSNFLGGSATISEGNCKNAADGMDCGDNKVCQTGKCIEECKQKYPQTGSCGDRAKCTGDSHVVTGLCPGGANNICCISDIEYNVKVPSSGSTENTAQASCSSQGGLCIPIVDDCLGNMPEATCGAGEKCCVAGCNQQGGKCMTKNECTNNDGKTVSAACGSGQICCQTCTSLGGWCLFGSSASCDGKTVTGICAADSAGNKGVCCLGNQLK